MIWGCPKRTQNRSRNRCQKRFDLGPSWGPILGAFWLPDCSNMASRAPKTAPRRPREPPRRLLYASRTTQHLPRRLQDRPQRAQDAPQALQEPPRPLTEPPRRLQELSLKKRFLRRRATSKSYPEEPSKPPAVALHPLASGLQVASAGCAKR